MNNPKVLLLIEDNPLLTGLYQTAFQKAGFDVIFAHDGAAVLALAKDKKPDTVVLDILMPGMDGFSVLQAIRADKETKDTKVVILTSRSDEESKKTARELGALDYLTKTELTLEEIVKRVGLVS